MNGMMPYPILKDSLKYKLVADIGKEYPKASEVVKKYFGEDCLERLSFKIKILEMACILFGVGQNRLIQEIENIQKN